MNKVVNINLGGFPFTIDDDAYSSLDKYLKTINKHFSKSEGHEDIVFDIENRIAELLREKMKSNQIVTQKHIGQIIEIMGRPESFTDEGSEETSNASSKSKQSTSQQRKLFRNPEDKYIGGVCSGLAAYFGIDNPNWVRLLFVILLVTMGVGPFVYIILWIFVPEAKHASDFLSMRGEPINAQNIAKTVEQELSDIKDKISDLGNEFKNIKL